MLHNAFIQNDVFTYFHVSYGIQFLTTLDSFLELFHKLFTILGNLSEVQVFILKNAFVIMNKLAMNYHLFTNNTVLNFYNKEQILYLLIEIILFRG